MKLIFVLPLMSGIGGIQSSLTNLLRALPSDRYSVSVCVFGNRIADPGTLPDNVAIVAGPKLLEYCLAGFRTSWRRYAPWQLPSFLAVKVAQRVFGYRRVLDFATARFKLPETYDVAIAYANDIYTPKSFIGGANDIVLRCVQARRRLAWIHNDPRRHGLTRAICLSTYADFDGVVNVSRTCQAIFDEIVPEFHSKSVVVYNTIDVERVLAMAEAPSPYVASDSVRLVSVARLDNGQKRIDRIIEACALLKGIGMTGFAWHIVGDGPDEPWLREFANRANVGDVLTFEGRKANPYPYIKNADVLVLSSDYEAFGMVLLEARALGVPVVVTRYDASVEIVAHGINGLIADPSSAGLAETLGKIMSNPAILATLRRQISARPLDSKTALLQFEDAVLGRGPRGLVTSSTQ